MIYIYIHMMGVLSKTTGDDSPLLDKKASVSPSKMFLSETKGEIKRNSSDVEVPSEEAKGTCCIDLKLLWAYTGPGWLMSIAYIDPGNLEADLQSGAYAGMQLLWMLFWATVAGLLLQILALRLGVVTGKNLAELCKARYNKPTSFILWIMTELAIIGSDIQEVVGSAIAFKILFGWKLWVGCIVTGVDTFTFLLLHILGTRALEAFFASLIFIMLICFIINFAGAHPAWLGEMTNNGGGILFGTAVPTVEDYALVQAVGILGAVIMPHNIYLHSALVTSRKINRKDPKQIELANKYFSIESGVALFVSFLINGAVVAVFSQGFFNRDECARPGWDTKTGVYSGPNQLVNGSYTNLACYPGADMDGCHINLQTGEYLSCKTPLGLDGKCCGIGLNNAGTALEGFLGKNAKFVWAIGLLAAGQSSTMTGTFAGQFVMEGFLNWKVSPWVRVLITRTFAIGPAIAVAIVSSSNATAGDILNEWLNVLQSVQLPFAVLPVLHFTSDKQIMGEFANHGIVKFICWFLAALVIVINIYLVTTFVTAPDSPTPQTPFFFTIVIVVGIMYMSFIFYVIKEDIKAFWGFIRGDTVDLNKICRYDSKGNDNDNDDDVYLQVCSEDDQNVNTSYGSL